MILRFEKLSCMTLLYHLSKNKSSLFKKARKNGTKKIEGVFNSMLKPCTHFFVHLVRMSIICPPVIDNFLVDQVEDQSLQNENPI